jgi:hypothetical protein
VCGQSTAHVSIHSLQQKLSWPHHRAEAVLGFMLQQGLAWIDSQDVPPSYWFPSLFSRPAAGGGGEADAEFHFDEEELAALEREVFASSSSSSSAATLSLSSSAAAAAAGADD